MAKSSFGEMRGRSEVLGLDIPVEPGLECGFMTRPPGAVAEPLGERVRLSKDVNGGAAVASHKGFLLG